MIKSSFFEFNTAVSGLFTAQANMQVSSHNIANSAITGYSRQYAMQRAGIPISANGRGMYGTGSEVYNVGQIRSSYLDEKYWSQRCTLGEYASKNDQLEILELRFNELTNSGINANFTELFNQMQEVIVNPADLTIRNNFLTIGENLTEYIQSLGNQLEKQQREINEEVKHTVEIINGLGQQIASITDSIRLYEIHGEYANDLRDARALLIDELSLHVNVEVNEVELNENFNPDDPRTGQSRKHFTLSINGVNFVKDSFFTGLYTVARDTTAGEKKNPNDIDGLYDIYISGSNVKFNIYSNTLEGTLKGLIDMRDGNNNKDVLFSATGGSNEYGEVFQSTSGYKGLPYFMDKLNSLIRGFTRGINEGIDYEGNPIPGVTGHIYGYDLNNNNGNVLFTYIEGGKTVNQVTPGDASTYLDYSKLNYSNFSVNEEMLRDPSLLSVSSELNSGESNGEIFLSLANLFQNDDLFAEGSVEDYLNGITVEVGILVNQANNFESLYTDNTFMTDNQRISVSGVDLNEEMMLMVKYQYQYQASSKLVNIIDSIYDTVINRLGV